MDFRRLGELLPDASSPAANGTQTLTLTELSPNILEALVPGYGLISRYIASTFGLDISLFVSAGLLLFATWKAGQYAYHQLSQLFTYFFMSSVHIDEHDDMFDMVMGWLAAHQTATSRSRKMRAKTQKGRGADDAYDAAADDALDENGMFNYNKWSARTPPRFEPYYGRQIVWHGGRMFLLQRARRPNEGQRLQLHFGNAPEDDIIEIDCIGRSIEPIKDLLKTVRVWSLNRTTGTTTIRHPTPKDRARFGGTWSKTSSRPSRPMDTVILDAEQKEMIIRDMNEYLHPASPKWYAMLGIPYRRGYLFHGPPGTGKTSLSFALAGIFGLEIYAISLQDSTLTEGDLMQLFNGLPRRCIVLLEDIDAAGLVRDGASEEEESKAGKPSEGTDDKAKKENEKEKKDSEAESKKTAEEFTLKDLAKELKAIGGGQRGGGRPAPTRVNNADSQSGGGISLSGLLNAIDGVATHEGRVLIMTTNYPEKLDPALVRPGRIDRRVDFKLAMREQIRELFIRMYAASEETSSSHLFGRSDMKSPLDQAAGMPREKLEKLAADFAAHVPDNTFTPAEVQNLLMMHKKHPQAAVDEVESWVRDSLREKGEASVAPSSDDDVEVVSGVERD